MRKLLTLQRTLTRKQRVILLLAVAAIVLVLLFAAVFGDRISFALRQLTRTQAEDFPHNAQSNSLFLGLGNNLLISTSSQIQVYSPSGSAKLKETVSMNAPAMNAAGNYAVV